MTVTDLGDFWVHTVSVNTYQGTTGAGVKSYAAPAARVGFVERKRRLVRDGNGTQVVSESTYYGDSGQAVDFPPQSQVTLPGETKPTTVIVCAVNDGGDLDLPDHIAVALQ